MCRTNAIFSFSHLIYLIHILFTCWIYSLLYDATYPYSKSNMMRSPCTNTNHPHAYNSVDTFVEIRKQELPVIINHGVWHRDEPKPSTRPMRFYWFELIKQCNVYIARFRLSLQIAILTMRKRIRSYYEKILQGTYK